MRGRRRARGHEREWGRLSAADRTALLHKVAVRMAARFDDFLEAEIADTGKSYPQARNIDIPRGPRIFEFCRPHQSLSQRSLRNGNARWRQGAELFTSWVAGWPARRLRSVPARCSMPQEDGPGTERSCRSLPARTVRGQPLACAGGFRTLSSPTISLSRAAANLTAMKLTTSSSGAINMPPSLRTARASARTGHEIQVLDLKMKWDDPTGHGIIFVGGNGQVYC
jgi:Aldehyde dehydrogenase family